MDTDDLDFTASERDFVRSGGNLWYVAELPDDGWAVKRWANSGDRHVVTQPASRAAAEWDLFEWIRPSSERARIHHCVVRRTAEQLITFPCLG